MKTILIIFTMSFFITTQAQNYKNAIGFKVSGASALGGPQLSYKHFISDNKSIEGLLAFRDPVALGAIYQVHQNTNALDNLTWFYGGGGFIAFSKPDVGIGVLGNIGLDYKFDNVPINIAIDWKPEFAFAPKAKFDFNTFGFALRYVIK